MFSPDADVLVVGREQFRFRLPGPYLSFNQI